MHQKLTTCQNKNCAPWSYDWFKSALPGVKVDDGKQSAEVVEVTSITGDCDLGQRKGKWVHILLQSPWFQTSCHGYS